MSTSGEYQLRGDWRLGDMPPHLKKEYLATLAMAMAIMPPSMGTLKSLGESRRAAYLAFYEVRDSLLPAAALHMHDLCRQREEEPLLTEEEFREQMREFMDMQWDEADFLTAEDFRTASWPEEDTKCLSLAYDWARRARKIIQEIQKDFFQHNPSIKGILDIASTE